MVKGADSQSRSCGFESLRRTFFTTFVEKLHYLLKRQKEAEVGPFKHLRPKVQHYLCTYQGTNVVQSDMV